MRHISGKNNSAAFALSRVDLNALDISQIIDFTTVAEAKQHDEELQMLRSNSTSLKFKKVPLPTSDSRIVCDVSQVILGLTSLASTYVQFLMLYTICLTMASEPLNI